MTRTWRNEWRWTEHGRRAFRWAVWLCVLGVGVNVLATVVQRLTEG